MNNPASSETLFGAVKQWVVSTFWWAVAMLVGPVVLLVAPFFFVAVGDKAEEIHDMAMLYLVVSPFVVCFWTVIVNRYCNIKDDPDSEVLSKRAVSFVGAFLLGFIMPVVAESLYIFLSKGMADVTDRMAWFLWVAGLEVAAISPIILLWARRKLVKGQSVAQVAQ